MANPERIPLKVGMDTLATVLWRMGWDPRSTYGLTAALAILGWVLFRHPIGLVLGVLAVVPRWKAVSLINRNWEGFVSKAESIVREQGAIRLAVGSDVAESIVLRCGLGNSPLGATAKREYKISVVYICDAFFAVYQGATLNLPQLEIRLPAQGEEVYFRHVSAVNYNPPDIEVVLSNGKTMRKFDVGSEGGGKVLGALRAKLRAATLDPGHIRRGALQQAETRIETPVAVAAQELAQTSRPHADPTETSNTERYCYLSESKLKQLLNESSVLEVLIEQLQVPGEPKILKRLTPQEKMQCLENQIDHFRRTPTSVWFGVPRSEVLAASIWRAGEDRYYRDRGLLTRKLVRREWFCGVSDEDDLQIPVAKRLRGRGYEPYMEIPLGLARVDVLGFMKSGILSSAHLVAVELKNDYEQFKRALNQMATFAEYTNGVYMACTPDFAAEYLDHSQLSTGHWDRDVLERKLIGAGFGLLIVERQEVFEVIKPTERVPSSANSAKVVSSLTEVNVISC
ncbi:MAG TPA: hypothetical protein VGS27_02235 [Candidatus Sulfotelmatobacter sp.]|nr:hypothetical protein [Candidatus Sulfotelmatobacter sp.]